MADVSWRTNSSDSVNGSCSPTTCSRRRTSSTCCLSFPPLHLILLLDRLLTKKILKMDFLPGFATHIRLNSSSTANAPCAWRSTSNFTRNWLGCRSCISDRRISLDLGRDLPVRVEYFHWMVGIFLKCLWLIQSVNQSSNQQSTHILEKWIKLRINQSIKQSGDSTFECEKSQWKKIIRIETEWDFFRFFFVVLLCPFGLAGIFTGKFFPIEKSKHLFQQWRQFFPLDISEKTDNYNSPGDASMHNPATPHDPGAPSPSPATPNPQFTTETKAVEPTFFVEVIVADVKMIYPSTFVLLVEDREVSAAQFGKRKTTDSAAAKSSTPPLVPDLPVRSLVDVVVGNSSPSRNGPSKSPQSPSSNREGINGLPAADRERERTVVSSTLSAVFQEMSVGRKRLPDKRYFSTEIIYSNFIQSSILKFIFVKHTLLNCNSKWYVANSTDLAFKCVKCFVFIPSVYFSPFRSYSNKIRSTSVWSPKSFLCWKSSFEKSCKRSGWKDRKTVSLWVFG